MRLSIDHKTGFRYSTKVKSSYNEARMTPVATSKSGGLGQSSQHHAHRLELLVRGLLGHLGDRIRGARTP